MKNTFSENILTLFPEGRIDGNNADSIEKDIFSVIDGCEGELKKIVFDFSDLSYISSAGLRIFIKIKRRIKDVEVINPTTEVYEILDITGFTNMLDVKRSMPALDINGLEVIGGGVRSKVLRLDDERVVKVFDKNCTLEWIEEKKQHATKLIAAGIPAAISFETVKCGDNYGIIYEMMNAKTVLRAVSEEPDKTEYYGREMGKLLNLLHANEFDSGFENYDDRIERRIDILEKDFSEYYDAQTISAMRKIRRSIKRRNSLVMGYFHEGNVMLHNGEMLIANFDEVGTGSTAYELVTHYMAHDVIADDPVRTLHMGADPDTLKALRKYAWLEFLYDDEGELKRLESCAADLSLFMKLMYPAANKEMGAECEKDIRELMERDIPLFRQKADEIVNAASYFNLVK